MEHLVAGLVGITTYSTILRSLEIAPLLTHGRRFSKLSLSQRQQVLDRWLDGGPSCRLRLSLLSWPLKASYFDDPKLYEQLGCVYQHNAEAEPKPRWWQQVRDGRTFPDEQLDCDVVVVGTGAGGAVVAKELAEAGYAVVMLEEGEYHQREEFSGRGVDMMHKLYRDSGATYSTGNTIIPIPLGRTVGGTTTINSGTCLRPPDGVLEHWQTDLGLGELTTEHMVPYFERVENELRVTEAETRYLGGAARVVSRGAEKLGWSHHPLPRNAPDCDGQGVCVFGCPTDAKRSTNVSFVPKALQAAAVLMTGVSATEVLLDGRRAAGVEAQVLGSERRLRIRARVVVLACGALITPALLLRQGLLRNTRQLGRNLTIHPAIAVAARFGDEEIRGWEAIPQGYCVDEFHAEGILMEGASLPLDAGATSLNLVGQRLIEVMEAYDRVAHFGAMVAERDSRGRVMIGVRGRRVIRYWLRKRDLESLRRAIVLIGRIFFASGASTLFPPVQGWPEIPSPGVLDEFARSPIRARDILLTAYHPLSTCRMGADPKLSVVDSDNKTHELEGLYITDGSAVPSSPMVNPQITIMALAARAAERIADRLS
ncbi:MAG: GMC family oxidoreductase N-terminal domain-containing protein [Candidatus Binatia bacterium]